MLSCFVTVLCCNYLSAFQNAIRIICQMCIRDRCIIPQIYIIQNYGIFNYAIISNINIFKQDRVLNHSVYNLSLIHIFNLYVSPVILSAIENHVSIQILLFTIVIFVLMMMLVSAALAYANQNVICGRISVRCEIVNLLNKKASTTSYPNIDDMKFKKLLTKSYEYTDNNDQATEAIWNTLTVLLKMCIRDSSRGDSGALYLQSATAGVMPI